MAEQKHKSSPGKLNQAQVGLALALSQNLVVSAMDYVARDHGRSKKNEPGIGQTIGLVIILALIVFVTFNDIQRLFG